MNTSRPAPTPTDAQAKADPLGRAFGRLWFGATASSFGDGMWFAAVPLLAASVTRDSKTISLLELAAAVPWLLWGFYAGVLADRWDRRRLMWISDIGRLVVTGVLAVMVAANAVTMPALLGVVFVLASISTVFSSAAPALLPDVVSGANLHRANARLAAGTTSGSSFLGPSIGALLFGLVAWSPFAIDALTFAVAALCVRGLPSGPAPASSGPRRSARHEMAEALAWLRGSRVLLVLAAATALLATATGAFLGTFVLFVLEVLRQPEQAYGGMIALFATGSLVGSVLSTWLATRLGTRLTIWLAPAVGGASFLGLGLSTRWPFAAVALLALGMASAVWNVAVTTVRQRVTPRPLLGRSTGLFLVITNASVALGAPAGGFLAHAFGLAAPLFAATTLAVVAAVVSLLWYPDTAPEPGRATVRSVVGDPARRDRDGRPPA
jgi:predicted MFS family arabinose efflux permease